jgi:hypothetical protein
MKKLLSVFLLIMCSYVSAQTTTKVDIGTRTVGVLNFGRVSAPGSIGQVPFNLAGILGSSNYFDISGQGSYAGFSGFSAKSFSTTDPFAGRIGFKSGPSTAAVPFSAGFIAPDSIPVSYSIVLPSAAGTGFWASVPTPSVGPTATGVLTNNSLTSTTSFAAGNASSTVGYPHIPPCVITGGTPTTEATCVWTVTGTYPNFIPSGVTITFGGSGYSTPPTISTSVEEELQKVTDVVESKPLTVVVIHASSIGATTLCTTTKCPVGLYRISGYFDITTACASSGSYAVNIIYTDNATSKTVVMIPAVSTTSTSNLGQGSVVIRSTGSVAIQYSTTAVACGSGSLTGNLYLTTEELSWQ